MQSIKVNCPYCGENFEALIDVADDELRDGGSIDYFEDCYVCCRPISFHITDTGADDGGGEPKVLLRRDDE